jgi:hypothetical protein
LFTALTLLLLWSGRSRAFAATTLTVTTAQMGIPGASLDQAISDGNTDSPPVTINFAIPPFDGTVKIIAPQQTLPTITNSLAINGFTQSGSSPGTPLIALDGGAVGGGTVATGLTFAVGGSVNGLIIQNFTGAGVSVTNGVTVSENVISNNFVGVGCSGNANSITGNVFVLNGTAIQLFGSSNSVVANVITNNNGGGLQVFGGNNTIVGCLISTNSGYGVNLNGGTNSFASDIISLNIAGGVLIDGDDNTFSNETIFANQADGVDITGSSNTLVNCAVLSNLDVGVNVGGSMGTTNNNNVFSSDTLSANGGDGLALDGSSNSLIASTISSNTGDGVLVSGTANIIGGTGAGDGNVIIQNSGNGIKIAGASPIAAEAVHLPADVNVVQGNFIGTDRAGTNNLGNSQSGVLVDGTLAEASTNLIGGELSGQPNIIAFNGSNGVTVVSNAVDNAIFGNSIFTNALLGVDLGADGVTPNHAFGVFPSGPNNFQNFPVLTAAVCSNSGVLILGSITNSGSSTPAHLEFFVNPACDLSGFGQGQVFLGSADVTTDLSGGAAFSAAFTNFDLVGEFITATASDSSSNTSEFSQCLQVVDNQAPTILQCASSITTSADANCEAVIPDFTNAVVATDNCTPAIDLVFTQSPTNGTIVTVGTNTVTITVTDQVGNSTNCTTSLIVVDTTPPVITCQADTNVVVGSSQSSAAVKFSTPTATDNCSATSTVTCVPASNSIFPLGTTPVVCTAVDGAGNTASCTFNVTVQAPELAIVAIGPVSCPAVVNTTQGGVIQVAIVGTESMNVSNIEPLTVTLNGVLDNTNFFVIETKNVVAPFVYTRGCPKRTKHGFPDLLVAFNVDELIASLGTVHNGEVKVLTVSGTFKNGTMFEGQDRIKISTEKCQLPKGLKNPF